MGEGGENNAHLHPSCYSTDIQWWYSFELIRQEALCDNDFAVERGGAHKFGFQRGELSQQQDGRMVPLRSIVIFPVQSVGKMIESLDPSVFGIKISQL